jgi:hypothetical protein
LGLDGIRLDPSGRRDGYLPADDFAWSRHYEPNAGAAYALKTARREEGAGRALPP